MVTPFPQGRKGSRGKREKRGQRKKGSVLNGTNLRAIIDDFLPLF
jgi:hypothetical protein